MSTNHIKKLSNQNRGLLFFHVSVHTCFFPIPFNSPRQVIKPWPQKKERNNVCTKRRRKKIKKRFEELLKWKWRKKCRDQETHTRDNGSISHDFKIDVSHALSDTIYICSARVSQNESRMKTRQCSSLLITTKMN